MRKIHALLIGLGISVSFLMGASYGVFSPGGALSGTWNSQNVELDAGASFIQGNLPVTNLGSGTGANASTFWRGDGTWAAAASSPGGANTQVQYNNSGAFGGDAGLTYVAATDTLTTGAGVLSSTSPSWDLSDTNSAASNQRVRLISDGDSFQSLMCNDAGSSCSAWLTVERTNNTTDLVAFTSASGLTINGTNINSTNILTSGTLGVARGGTGTTTSTGTGSTVLSASPALTGTPTVGGQSICLADGTNCPGASQTVGSYTATATGCTTSPTVTVEYVVTGDLVSLYIPALTCTSNTTTFTLTGGPAAVQPDFAVGSSVLSSYTNGGGSPTAGGLASMGTNGTLTLGFVHPTDFFGSWSNSGTKGYSASVMTYVVR